MMIKVIDSQATAQNIKRMLDERGITARMVQEALQLESIQAVYKWFRTAKGGKTNSIPSIDNMVLLAELMNVTLEDILVLRRVEISRDDITR